MWVSFSNSPAAKITILPAMPGCCSWFDDVIYEKGHQGPLEAQRFLEEMNSTLKTRAREKRMQRVLDDLCRKMARETVVRNLDIAPG